MTYTKKDLDKLKKDLMTNNPEKLNNLSKQKIISNQEKIIVHKNNIQNKVTQKKENFEKKCKIIQWNFNIGQLICLKSKNGFLHSHNYNNVYYPEINDYGIIITNDANSNTQAFYTVLFNGTLFNVGASLLSQV